MDFNQKAINSPDKHTIGYIKYLEAANLAPVGQMQFQVLLFDNDSVQKGEIKKIRIADIFIDWNGLKIRYPDDLSVNSAIKLAEEIFVKNPKNHDELKDVVNDFARSLIEARPQRSEFVERS